MGKRLSLKEINIAKHEEKVFNSRIKRGDIDSSQFVRTAYVVCGCGREGCGFITRWCKNQHNVIDLEAESKRYDSWLEQHQH